MHIRPLALNSTHSVHLVIPTFTLGLLRCFPGFLHHVPQEAGLAPSEPDFPKIDINKRQSLPKTIHFHFNIPIPKTTSATDQSTSQPPINKMLHHLLLPLLPLILPTTAQTPTTSYLPQPSLTPQNPNCTTPTGFSNRVVTLPSPLATPSFEVAPTFASTHLLFLFDSLNGLFSRAAVGTFCLEQCIAYKAPTNTTKGDRCLSFNVNLGKPIPAESEEGDAERWFCSGFDAYLSAEVVEKREVEGSFLYPVAVNRACGGTYRDY